MKKWVYILFVLIFACDSEDAFNCFQAAGSIIQKSFEVSPFNKILVNRDVQLIVKQGDDFNVIIETGDNLLNDISVKVINNQLILTDNNTCNFVREYGLTKAYITVPNLTKIRSSSQYEVSSEGVLNFPELQIISDDFAFPDSFNIGDFRLEINSSEFSVIANNISSFYISGTTELLEVNFFAGSGRFEGENLIAQSVSVFHRGSNDMIVNPQESLSGELRGTGNLISVNEPQIVNVEQFYIGQLIFD